MCAVVPVGTMVVAAHVGLQRTRIVTAPPSAAPDTHSANAAPPANSASEAGTASNAKPTAAELVDLDRQVKEYNSLLRRIQEAQRNYTAAHQTTLSGTAQQNEVQSALDRQNTYLDELVAAVQQAQAAQSPPPVTTNRL